MIVVFASCRSLLCLFTILWVLVISANPYCQRSDVDSTYRHLLLNFSIAQLSKDIASICRVDDVSSILGAMGPIEIEEIIVTTAGRKMK